MQFCDEVKVTFIAGKGGNGCVAFHREKYVPKGGPDGGDGGQGGSIILEVDSNINTLSAFNRQKIHRAKNGDAGMGSNMHGKSAEDLVLKVPPGTLVLNETKTTLLKDLKEIGERLKIVCGGRGGFGNAHFTSSTRQKPSFAELGEPGEEKTVHLELKLVADVGIIGLPSVGKSTLITRISNAHPKIADYPFTTLIPNLGIVVLDRFGGEPSQSFVACDLPGLIEDASKGKGLGIQFLKHVARNRMLIHLLDASRDDLKKDYKTIHKELKKFDQTLMEKKEIIAINKIDLIDEKTKKEKQKIFGKKKVYFLSCATGKGLRELLFAAWNLLRKIPKEKEMVARKKTELAEYKVYRPHLEDPHYHYVERVKKGVFIVKGKRIEQIAVMTNLKNPEAIQRLYDVLLKMGIQTELKRYGAKEGDRIHIRDRVITFHEL